MFLIPTLTLIGPVFCCRGPGQEFPAHPPHILDTVPRTKKKTLFDSSPNIYSGFWFTPIVAIVDFEMPCLFQVLR